MLAGFGPEANRYYLPRDIVKPPKDLIRLVFPSLDDSLASFDQLLVPDIAGRSLLFLLQYMRAVILQDACILTTLDDFKAHPVF